MMSLSRQFSALLWKNFVLRKRRPLVTACEMVLPLLFSCIILFWTDWKVEPKVHVNQTVYESFSIDALPRTKEGHLELAYVPRSALSVVLDVKQSLSSDGMPHGNVFISLRGFDTEKQFEDYVRNDNQSANVFAAVVFEPPFVGTVDERLPQQVSYHLRFPHSPGRDGWHTDSGWHTDRLFPSWPDWLGESRLPPRVTGDFGGDPNYYSEGFLALQHAVDRAIMRAYNRTLADSLLSRTRVLLSRFPYPAYTRVNSQGISLHLLLVLSFLFTSVNMVQAVAQEKENKLKEYMRIMGVSNWLHWSAWFLTFLLSLSVTIFLVTLLLCLPVRGPLAALSNSDPTLVFVFLLVFAVATINFSFMISTFFSRAHVAVWAGYFIYTLSYLPYLIVRLFPLSHALRTLVCLISNVALATGADLFGKFEAKGDGMRWSNLFESEANHLSLATVLGMLMLDAWLYGLVAWYVEAVFPGEYGVPLPWYFFILPSYWRSSPRAATVSGNEEEEEEEVAGSAVKGEFMEEEPTGLVPGVQIRHLTKEFRVGGQTQQAVRDLTLNMFEGQITVLLGHNGAGKTTTLSMLTGLLPPTSGRARVNGHDICHEMALVRRSLALCPQHNILFHNLTVSEHLFFYAQLKGFPRERIPDDVDHLLSILNMEDKRHARAKTLSGGTKRKLSIGIALAGGSKVVMLDEPTTGMDPAARRAALELLQGEKRGRTVVITTHMMDEADRLGDRVAIMAGGELQCCGSPLFLKNKYGAGYHMVIVKEAVCDVSEITRLVQGHVPNATLESNVATELSYILPKESTDRFEELFSQLEANREKLGVSSYGASLTTMEEVFLRVGELADSSLDVQQKTADDAGSAGGTQDTTELADSQMLGSEDVNLNTGLRLCVQQFYAMFLKRALYSLRNWKVTMAQFLVPLVLTAFVIVLLQPHFSRSPSLSQPNLNLNLSHYGHTRVPVVLEPGDALAEAYISQVHAAYASQVSASGAQIIHVDGDFNDYILTQAEKEGKAFDQQCVVGAVLRGSSGGSSAEVTAYFNIAGYHTPATALWMVDNALFKLVVGNPSASIRTGNWPMSPRPISKEEEPIDLAMPGISGYHIAIGLMCGMAFLSSTFALLLVTERTVKSKHVQQVSGVYLANYWFSALLWDLLNFLLPCLLLLGLFGAFEEEAFVGGGRAASTLLMLMLYGWAVVPLMYLLSFLFSTPSSAYKCLAAFNILSGSAISATSLDPTKVLDKIFRIFPSYCLGMSFSQFYRNFAFASRCTSSLQAQAMCKVMGVTYHENYFSMSEPGVGRYLVCLSVQGVVFMALLFVIELQVVWTLRRFFGSLLRSLGGRLSRRRPLTADTALLPEDSDVAAERSRLLEWRPAVESAAGSPLVMQELSKAYGGAGTPLAVDRLSLAAAKGECFGLLGFNGAGKTATFKMLTGDESVTSGDAYVDGHSVRSAVKMVQRRVGYCPQFDALLDHMTGRETLCMYARLRGIPERRLSACVQNLLVSLLLEPHADKPVGAYSGGSKRKLSAGVALIGGPPLVLLDEPSSGMDPRAKRLLWDAVTRATRESGKAVVITTHNMEECEALCTRLGVMVNGRLKCLGSAQHLKSKFGSGYTLLAKVARPHDRAEEVEDEDEDEEEGSNLQRFKRFVERTFPVCRLKDEHQGTVNYHLAIGEGVTWARVFGAMEAAKEKYRLEDYGVGQVSLEQVFLSFAQFQHYADQELTP